ncbi:MAG: hypothetical protein A2297_02980 [Elusimicrobia bacterium RIFOXYB2_FULL_48_7]|nr:MAG: hypothetical protein A2297_02980 [Elusimicrobia bacterium RIFOXYB2_FULL_48_7]
MNTRERFNKVMHWQKPDRVPNMDFGYWEETIDVLHKQGLPENIKTDQEVEKYLGLEGIEIINRMPVKNQLYPGFEPKVLEDHGDYQIILDKERNTCKVLKNGSSMPQFIKYGLETKDDWKIHKERLDFTTEGRIGDIKKAVKEAHETGMPLKLSSASLYGWLRDWMGVENFSIAVMTEKEWVEEMMQHILQLTVGIIEKALPQAKGEVDAAFWWEDMCYNHGSLISPKLFEELMVPRYRIITQTMKKYGVDVNILDCDGKIYELVPSWIKGGINCMFPIEAAHTDPLKLRQDYGHDLLLVGGVNKVQLSKGRDSIDRELERLQPLVEEGGYIPCVDHRVPPDVSFVNYLYYLEKKKQILK